MILLRLFLSFFKIGLFSFGGGYAMLPIIQREVISVNSWVTKVEFLDMLAIAQITPGPIAINTATFVGQRLAGIGGATVATFAVVLPSFIIVIAMSYILEKLADSKQIEHLYKGLRPIVLALIFSALVSIGIESIVDIKSAAIATLCFGLLNFKKINLIWIILISGLLGMVFY